MHFAELLAPWAVAACLLAPTTAAAHIEISSHITRHGKNQQKVGPCGAEDEGGPGDNIYVYEPGETVAIAWHEFVDHPGHYRVSFAEAGDDEFVDPATADERYSNDAVLLDGIDDVDGVDAYEVEVTLPQVECDACTIQIVQVMTDKAPYGDGNDLYYHCVDVQLVTGGGPDMLEEGCGCTLSGDPGRGLSLVMLVGIALLRPRRRPRRRATAEAGRVVAGRVASIAAGPV